jgi:NAD(P)-dependent dehydrogenase (short-subunit alcohol dehydrogenase family)
MADLKDKVVFITGAASGIGKATALKCTEYGAKIAAADIREDVLAGTVKEINDAGGDAIAIGVDVTNRASVQKAVKAAIDKFGKIDCLFNNAGVCISNMMVDVSDEEYDKTMDIDVKGAFIVATEVAKEMIKKKKGRIVNTASISAYRGEYGNMVYCMAKAAVRMMTRGQAIEWSEHGVTAVAISPGHIHTELLHGAFVGKAESEGKNVDDFYEEMAGTIAVGRLGEPREVAEVVAWLFDERSYYVNGISMLIDGGKAME